MDLTKFLISVFCMVDDFLKDKRLRQRGPQPILSVSEVVTMEIVGEFLGIDTDRGIFRYFRGHRRRHLEGCPQREMRSWGETQMATRLLE
jgi:hypothetical protein